jgi:drug/metabolite transporter (DMT)-like permease
MKNVTRHHYILHGIVFIWGWTPILGKAISVGEIQLVWFRIILTIATLLGYFFVIRQKLHLEIMNIFKLAGIGGIIALHWLFFYGAIKVSNVSVAMAGFSTGTLFTSIIEPIFFKRRIYWYELLIGLLIIAGISVIFTVELHYWLGITLGMLAALTSSLFSVFNALLIRKIHANLITFYELAGGFILLSIYLLIAGKFNAGFFNLSGQDWFLLSVLAICCTAFPFIISVNLMKNLSPYTITLTVNLETVYGIILAYLLWQKSEQMTPWFYLGTTIILSCIFLNALLKNKFKKT